MEAEIERLPKENTDMMQEVIELQHVNGQTHHYWRHNIIWNQ